ncbi:MAG: 4-hydroxy-tetrahydrodipicolinate synthase [Chloroflexi bacterium]|nr:4-hydroxy-tetrahydrodipicolinate synthase [Chloroflexota bacterium]|tara:strand:- start:19678 stop:20568 length:891 start_codon:yes stop_codon:yes gene_type:complete
MKKIGRLLTAMITPFDKNGNIDYNQAKKLANSLINSGSDGLVIGGTTGEAPSMSDEEKIQLFKAIVEEVGDRGSVIAGTTDNNHIKSIELSKEAEKVGVDALLLTVPAYNKPQQTGLFFHFKAIAESTNLPCILYNVPGRTSLNMTTETTLKLAEINNVIGIKEASSDIEQITNIIKHSNDNFQVWSGNDDETFGIMTLGGFGIVSVASNIIGNQIKKMMNHIIQGDFIKGSDEHKRLLPIFKALFWETNPVPIKYAVNKSGFNVGSTRLPMYAPSKEFTEKFDPIFDKYEIDLKN